MKWAMDCTGSGFSGEYEFALKKLRGRSESSATCLLPERRQKDPGKPVRAPTFLLSRPDVSPAGLLLHGEPPGHPW